MRLLLVDDEEGLVSALRAGLGRGGYAVDTALTGTEAVGKLATTAYDLVVLDITLPDTDGFALCRAIRGGRLRGDTPRDVRILMLTARSSMPDRVRGLDEGADDYLVKPFALAELLARIRALLRRDTGVATPVLRVADVELDVARQVARRDGRELALTRKEFGVLRYLMTRPGHVISAEELLEHVWDENADPFTQTVRVTVGTLRRKLGAGAPEDATPLLETVIGRGYRLVETP